MITPSGSCKERAAGRRAFGTRRRCKPRSRKARRSTSRLAKAVPVIWVYLTGWSNGDGPAKFRDDVYGIDTVGEAQANAQASPAR